jgi:pyruvate dehydrogenase complex dehydrogenase (E1) component
MPANLRRRSVGRALPAASHRSGGVRRRGGDGGHCPPYAPSAEHPGDLILHQGHSSPGIYARSYLEGRLTEENLDLLRMEVAGHGKGLPSYPHPWLMPDYWQVPTVSMGLGPLQAIYQAEFF